MNQKKLKEAIKSVLQYGVNWGHPKHIKKEHWNVLHEFYKEDLNNGKEFKRSNNKQNDTNDYEWVPYDTTM